MEKQKTASKYHVMKISKIANSAETRLFRTRRGEIDPGESESSLKTACHENRDFCKSLEIRTRRGEIDPADSGVMLPRVMLHRGGDQKSPGGGDQEWVDPSRPQRGGQPIDPP